MEETLILPRRRNTRTTPLMWKFSVVESQPLNILLLNGGIFTRSP